MAEKQFHIACSRGDVGEYCILPGDPERCSRIADQIENAKFVMQNREFTTYTGTLNGRSVSVCSTGIGGPSSAIAMEELAALGVHTFIRVGTCGGINTSVEKGDCVIAMASVRQEGTSLHYAPEEYPASADFDVTCALARAAKKLGYKYHVGVVQSKDSFYGQHSPDRMPVSYELKNKWEAWKRLGVLASEMETAAQFCVAASLGVKCGAVLHVLWNQERQQHGMESGKDLNDNLSIEVAVEAIKLLISND